MRDSVIEEGGHLVPQKIDGYVSKAEAGEVLRHPEIWGGTESTGRGVRRGPEGPSCSITHGFVS